MRILFIGDIFGRPGRHLVAEWVPDLVKQRAIDLVIANAENAAAGFGLTPAIAMELLGLGIEVLTTGNHVWDKRELIEFFQQSEHNFNENARRVLRPANFPQGSPGWGVYEGKTRRNVPFAVVNLQGRVFMAANDDPFRIIDDILKTLTARVVFIDFHAEATSEKVAFGWYVDGRATAIVGTHTHIPTADEHVLPKGTAYITDVGMSGPYDSVIGVEKELALHRFLSGMPARFEPAKGDPRLCGVIVECDQDSGRASSIERLMLAPREHRYPEKQ